MVKTVKSLTDFEEDLTNAGSILVVVYFHSEWNRDCHTITHVIKELEGDYSDVMFLRADVDEAELIPDTFHHAENKERDVFTFSVRKMKYIRYLQRKRDVAGKYEIYEMPTFKFFRYGTLINELTGANTAQLKHFVDTLR